MIISITFPSSLNFWLSPSSKRLAVIKRTGVYNTEPALSGHCPKDELLDIAETYDIPFPLHVAVPSASLRGESQKIIYHVMPSGLPANAYVRLSDNVYISSPELAFIEAANYYTFHKLVLNGIDLCANYVKNPNADLKQSQREPVTSPELINGLVSKVKNMHGVRRARQTLPYVVPNSNSPVETKLATVGIIPALHGGFALDNLTLNLSANLSMQGSEYLGRDSCLIDLGWEGKKVGLEYDSNLTHLNINQHFYDKKKATALAMSGYNMVYATAENLRSVQAIENMFFSLRKSLSLNPRTQMFEKYYAVRRKVICDLFFESHRHQQF